MLNQRLNVREQPKRGACQGNDRNKNDDRQKIGTSAIWVAHGYRFA
jgi:hypothetical protein